jgi:hypothetical protein
MPYPPSGYNICPCCGVEYGVDDAFDSHEELRDMWLQAGAPWFSSEYPYLRLPNWDAWNQLDLAGYRYNVARPVSSSKTDLFISRIPEGFELMRVVQNAPEWAEA